jgi:hypothetical protein
MTSKYIGRVTEHKIGAFCPSAALSASKPFSFVKKNDICGGETSEPLKVVNCWMRKG